MDLLNFFQKISTPFLDNLFEFITFLGEEPIYILVMVVMYWCFNKKNGVRLAFTQLFSIVVNGAIKDLIKAPRPIGEDGIISKRIETATGFSFPSGHTQGTATFWTTLMKIYKKSWLYILGATLIISVGTSRLYLGVHWPQDVLGGIFFGIISMFIASIIVDAAYASGKSSYFLILVIPSLLGLIFFHSEDYLKGVALTSGFYIGYLVEIKYINFNTKTTNNKQALKVLLGIAGVIIIMVPFKAVLPHNELGIFIRYSFLGLWVVAGAPYTFMKLGLSSPLAHLLSEKVSR